MTSARWLRIGSVEAPELFAITTGLASGTRSRGTPSILWAHARGPICLGGGSTLGDLVWADDRSQVCVAVVPRRVVPGRSARWLSWFLAPAVAACRELGLTAVLDGAGIGVHGRVVARGTAALAGDCVVMASSLPAGLIPWIGVDSVLEQTFRKRIEAQYGWQFEHSWPDANEREAIHRARAVFQESMTAALVTEE